MENRSYIILDLYFLFPIIAHYLKFFLINLLYRKYVPHFTIRQFYPFILFYPFSSSKELIVFRKRKLLSGVAALFLICIGAYWLLHSDKQPEVCPQKVVEQINSGEKKAILTLADGKQVELVSGSAVDKDLGIVQVTGDSMAGLVYRAKDTIVKALEYHLLSVPRAGEYVMSLSDGT